MHGQVSSRSIKEVARIHLRGQLLTGQRLVFAESDFQVDLWLAVIGHLEKDGMLIITQAV